MTRGGFLLCKRKPNRIRRKLRKYIFLLVLFTIVFTLFFELQAIPFTAKCIRKQAKAISAEIISDTIEKVFDNSDIDYDALAEVKTGEGGAVKGISAKAEGINRLKAKVTKALQKELNSPRHFDTALPIGSFTGTTLLSTVGPEVHIGFTLTGSVNIKLKSTFESAGINQTIHHIRLIIKTEIITVSLGFPDSFNYKTDYEVAQTVIVGETPSTLADIVR